VLQYWIMLLPIALHNLTPCADFLPAPADCGGFCDAFKHVAGGVWFGLEKALSPIVWPVQFTEETQLEPVSQDNPIGRITNSDLEMRFSSYNGWFKKLHLIELYIVLVFIRPFVLTDHVIGCFKKE